MERDRRALLRRRRRAPSCCSRPTRARRVSSPTSAPSSSSPIRCAMSPVRTRRSEGSRATTTATTEATRSGRFAASTGCAACVRRAARWCSSRCPISRSRTRESTPSKRRPASPLDGGHVREMQAGIDDRLPELREHVRRGRFTEAVALGNRLLGAGQLTGNQVVCDRARARHRIRRPRAPRSRRRRVRGRAPSAARSRDGRRPHLADRAARVRGGQGASRDRARSGRRAAHAGRPRRRRALIERLTSLRAPRASAPRAAGRARARGSDRRAGAPLRRETSRNGQAS